MQSRKFDPKDIDKLNRPERLQTVNPDLIWNALDLRGPKTLIDIGVGTGFFAVPFCRKMEGGKIYACDISDEMLRWMNEHLPQDVRSCVIPVKMEESVVPLPDGIADLVYMINLHHELERPREIVREAQRLLKKGGKLLIIDWKKKETPEGPPVSIRVTEEDIVRDMKEGGFIEVTIQPKLAYHTMVIGTKQLSIQKTM
jgi:ubiquinone/menaquinone biosynthesis C-methylase UbiE